MAQIPIPNNAEKIIDLLKEIYSKHQLDGDESPLKDLFNMENLNNKNEKAENLNDKALKANRQKEKFNEQRDNQLKDIRKELRRIRDYLLVLFPDNPHALGDWGFEVQGTGTGGSEGGGESESMIQLTAAVSGTLRVEVGMNGTGIYSVEWGDNQTEIITLDGSSVFAEHIYGEAGTYHVKIRSVSLNKLTEFHSNSSQLIKALFPLILTSLTLLVLQNNNLNAQAVNDVLIALDRMGLSNITINLLNNAAPTGDGLAAKVNLLARGCMVLTD